MRHQREPALARLGLGFILFVAVVIAAIGNADADTMLPVVCNNTAYSGRAINDCNSLSQVFNRAGPTSLVRACTVETCTYADRRWQRYSEVPSTSFVEVCAAEQTPGTSINGGSCQGTTSSTWGAMRMVAPSQVATTSTTPDGGDLPGTFTVTPASGVSPVTATLAWNVPTTCTNLQASGSWTGAKAQSGSQQVTNVTMNASYTLTCSTQGTAGGSAQFTWTPPTKNTDGSTLTDLAGYRLVHGTAANALNETINISGATESAYTATGLPAGLRYFALIAYTTNNARQSAPSATVSKTIAGSTPGATFSSTRVLTVEPAPPNPPSGFSVSEPTAFRLKQNRDKLVVARAGSVPLGTPCDETQHAMGLYLIKRATITPDPGQSRPYVALAKCAQ